MPKKLEKLLSEIASKLTEIFKNGKCTEKIKGYVLEGEKIYECPECNTLNGYELGPESMKCDSCGHFYSQNNSKK